MVDDPPFRETIANLRTITDNNLGRSEKVLSNRFSPKRVWYGKSDPLLFLNMFKNSSQSKPIRCRSSWSSEGPLKVPLSRLPSGAFVFPLEFSSTLRSFCIPSATLCQGLCEEGHKELIVTKHNSKIWFYISSNHYELYYYYQYQRIINQIYFFKWTLFLKKGGYRAA